MRLSRTRTAVAAAALAVMVTALADPAAAVPPAPSAEPATAPQAGLEHQVAQLRTQLGAEFGGAWLAEDGRLTVGITDPAAADRVRAAGAEPRLVEHSDQRLSAAKAALDRAVTPSESITSWYVDSGSNTVVVEADPTAGAEVTRFIEDSGVDEELVAVEAANGTPRLLQPWPIQEGDPYYVGGARCTVGFLVSTSAGQDGFVTAGHCGEPGYSVYGPNYQPQGTFQASQFPGSDHALVIILDENWYPDPITRGAAEAPVGASVCKIGSTTGYTCGTLQAKNVTVNYPQGTVYGLSRTNLCAEPGDSGGPVFSGNFQGQGIVSGGSGNCSFGGTTFFQPLLPILQQYGLTLITG